VLLPMVVFINQYPGAWTWQTGVEAGGCHVRGEGEDEGGGRGRGKQRG
jgi:hypothetical protein